MGQLSRGSRRERVEAGMKIGSVAGERNGRLERDGQVDFRAMGKFKDNSQVSSLSTWRDAQCTELGGQSGSSTRKTTLVYHQLLAPSHFTDGASEA